jgi:hypothetical protein
MKATEGGDAPKPTKGPNCWDCRYLAITWDVRLPYGCKFMGFRSKMIPSLEVLRNDGRFCSAFSPKPTNPAANKAQTASTQAVGQPSNRRETDRTGPFISINLIT